MKLIVIESPYFNENPNIIKYNLAYANECMRDALYKNEAPYLSHLLYTRILDDNIPIERNFGIEAGFHWGKASEKTVVYTDLGISKGMMWGVENAIKNGKAVEYRTLPAAHFEKFHEEHKHLLEPITEKQKVVAKKTLKNSGFRLVK